MIITRRRNRLNHPELYLNGDVISEVDQHTHLGVTISNTLSWSFHINAAIAKADKRLSFVDVKPSYQEVVKKCYIKQPSVQS